MNGNVEIGQMSIAPFVQKDVVGLDIPGIGNWARESGTMVNKGDPKEAVILTCA